MASVYRARQVLLDRDVALKVMSSQLAQDEANAERFLQEARMLGALNHPNVVQVYDVGVTPAGLHYFSMALLTGGDFTEKMAQGLSETELLRVLVSVGTALGFAHARGYVHRDVTPGNILFDAHGTPVLTDFGIARALSAVSRLTGSGMSIGTSHYMSPEQARGSPDIDHRADIYGLGVLCYEAVAGETPFNGQDSFAVAFAHVNDAVPRLPEEVARWQPLIDKAMAKNPADRYQDCSEFIEGLKQVAPDEFATLRPLVAPPPPRRTPAPVNTPPAKTAGPGLVSRWPLMAAAAAGVLLIVAGLWLWIGGDSSNPPAAPSTQAADAGGGPPADIATTAATPPKPADPEASEASGGLDGLSVPLDEDALAQGIGQTVRDPVVALLAAARANVTAQRYTTPPVTNALERYQLVLRIEPDNEDAVQGIVELARIYLANAEQQLAAGDTDGWLVSIERAEKVAAMHPAAVEPLAEARRARDSRAKRLVEAGQQAVLAFQRDAAINAYTEALRIAPGLQSAQSGLAQARQVGKVGYQFSDALKSGAAGPRMVVTAAGLATASREISRDEFALFWNAAGRQRFEGSVECRNRDTGNIFGGLKSRTWQEPDIAQTGNHPVVCVSYPMAQAYVEWLSTQTGQRYRLPTVAELAPFTAPLSGDCKSNLREGKGCNDGFAETAPVASYAARGPGLFDVVGNVSEWTSDCDRGNCAVRIALGGNWHTEPGDSLQLPRPADSGFNTVGFRPVREILGDNK